MYSFQDKYLYAALDELFDPILKDQHRQCNLSQDILKDITNKDLTYREKIVYYVNEFHKKYYNLSPSFQIYKKDGKNLNYLDLKDFNKFEKYDFFCYPYGIIIANDIDISKIYYNEVNKTTNFSILQYIKFNVDNNTFFINDIYFNKFEDYTINYTFPNHIIYNFINENEKIIKQRNLELEKKENINLKTFNVKNNMYINHAIFLIKFDHIYVVDCLYKYINYLPYHIYQLLGNIFGILYNPQYSIDTIFKYATFLSKLNSKNNLVFKFIYEHTIKYIHYITNFKLYNVPMGYFKLYDGNEISVPHSSFMLNNSTLITSFSSLIEYVKRQNIYIDTLYYNIKESPTNSWVMINYTTKQICNYYHKLSFNDENNSELQTMNNNNLNLFDKDSYFFDDNNFCYSTYKSCTVDYHAKGYLYQLCLRYNEDLKNYYGDDLDLIRLKFIVFRGVWDEEFEHRFFKDDSLFDNYKSIKTFWVHRNIVDLMQLLQKKEYNKIHKYIIFDINSVEEDNNLIKNLIGFKLIFKAIRNGNNVEVESNRGNINITSNKLNNFYSIYLYKSNDFK